MRLRVSDFEVCRVVDLLDVIVSVPVVFRTNFLVGQGACDHPDGGNERVPANWLIGVQQGPGACCPKHAKEG